MKLLIFCFLLLIGTTVAGFYGAIHNQISYTLCPEFFINIRFKEFNIPAEEGRWGSAVIGWKNTWKFGLALSLILSFIGLLHPTAGRMLNVTFKSILINIGIAFLIGLLGLLLGYYIYHNDASNSRIPDNIFNKENFVAVQTMHNFSYWGGILGVLIALLWNIFRLNKLDIRQ